MKLNINSLLKDKNVLYIVLFLAVTNFIGYFLVRDFDAVIFFLIVEPHGIARLWQIAKEKLRLWPFPH